MAVNNGPEYRNHTCQQSTIGHVYPQPLLEFESSAWVLQANTRLPRKTYRLSREWRNEDPEPRVGGGAAEKKIVTSPILMAEVVVEAPKGTLDGSPGVQDVFESP